MRDKTFPDIDTLLPAALWRRFAKHHRRATGLDVLVLDGRGRVVAPAPAGAGLCAGLGAEAGCEGFYRKVVQQVVGGDEVALFRCPAGTVVFAAPVRLEDAGGERWVLVGGVAVPEPVPEGLEAQAGRVLGAEAARKHLAGLPRMDARRLQGAALFARFCLQTAVRGQLQRSEASRRHNQVLTLFELASDLGQASGVHEIFALALNTLGVLFEVGSAAVLVYEAGADTYRVHTAMGPGEQTLLSWAVNGLGTPLEPLSRPGEVVRLDDAHRIARLGLPEDVDEAVAFSMASADHPAGALLVLNPTFGPDDEQLIRGFATEIGMAVAVQRLREDARRKAEQLDAVRTLSRQFTESLEPDALFEVILEEARKLTGARKGSLMVAANGNGLLAVRAVAGMNERVVERLRIQSGQGIAGTVFASGDPVLVTNIEHDARFRRRNRPRYHTKSFLSLPIRVDRRILGVLNLSDKATGEVFSEEDLDLLDAIAAQATVAIERSTYYAQSRELRRISITDPLTGLLNRRYFQERLAEEVDRATRHGHPLSLIMIDIDHFKPYNDANGHPAGDKALVLLGRVLRASIRTIDVVSRYGGEEFAVILPETRKGEAAEIGERIRTEVEGLCFPGEEAVPGGRLTVSLGVAGFPEDARDMKKLIHRADRALYQAKEQGRNRIVVYGTTRTTKGDPQSEKAWTRVL